MRAMWKRVLTDKGGFLQNFLESGGGGLFGFGVSKAMGENEESLMASLEIPDWKEDLDYRKSQDYLSELGINILEGDIPDYYKGIGETGGAEFENYLNLMKGDVEKSALETSAALGRGGGAAIEMANSEVGRLSTEARYQDYVRSLAGKESLLNKGIGITEGVRGSGQNQQAQENTFALNRTKLDFQKRSYLDDYNSESAALAGDNMGNLISMGVNAGVGFATGGPIGAVAGAMGGMDWANILKGSTKPTTTSIDKTKRTSFGKIKGLSAYAV